MRIMLLIMLAGLLFFSGCSSCARETAKEDLSVPPAQMEHLKPPRKMDLKLKKMKLRKQMSPSLMKKLMKRKKDTAPKNETQEKKTVEPKEVDAK